MNNLTTSQLVNQYLHDNFLVPSFEEITIQYFMNNIHIEDVVFYHKDSILHAYIVDEYVLKTAHVPIGNKEFIIIQECLYCVENFKKI